MRRLNVLALLGVVGCTRGSVETDSALPDCPSPVTLPFSPTLVEQVRFDSLDADWSGEYEKAEAVTVAEGTLSAEFGLNRGKYYQLSGWLEGAGSMTLNQTLEAGGRIELARFEEGKFDERVLIEENGMLFDWEVNAPARFSVQVTGETWAALPDVVAEAPVMVGYLMHIEESPRFLTDYDNWRRRARVVEAVSATLAQHGLGLNLQPGSSFIKAAEIWESDWVAARLAEGMAFSGHLHNEAEGDTALEKAARTAANDFEAAGVDLRDINGGFSTGIWQRMAAAGYRSATAFKNPDTQLDLALPATQPWRLAEGATAADEAAFSTHMPGGPIIYIPGSGVREAELRLFDDYLRGRIDHARATAREGFVNTWYAMDHVDGYGPDPDDPEFDSYLEAGLAEDVAVVDAAITTVLDPLVTSGEVVYSTPDGMRKAFVAWEKGCK